MDFFTGATFLIREDNAYFFFKILWYGGCLFQGLHLKFLPNVLGSAFIPGATSIPESRVFSFLREHRKKWPNPKEYATF